MILSQEETKRRWKEVCRIFKEQAIFHRNRAINLQAELGQMRAERDAYKRTSELLARDLAEIENLTLQK